MIKKEDEKLNSLDQDGVSYGTGAQNSRHLAISSLVPPNESWLGSQPELASAIDMGGPIDAPDNLVSGSMVKGFMNKPKVGLKKRGM